MQSKLVPGLSSGPVSLRPIRDQERRDLLELLDSVPGRKALVLEREFTLPLSFIADASLLREHGVEVFSALDSTNVVAEDATILWAVYVLHAVPESLSDAIKSVVTLKSERPDIEVTWALVPRRTTLASRLLEAEGLAADVELRELPIHWIPLDDDMLSLELPTAYSELVLTDDPSPVWAAASALTALQRQLGTIRHVSGIGAAAVRVQDVMSAQRAEAGSDAPTAASEGIDRLVLVDRGVDMLSALCTQFTYEGLLDETFGVRCGQVAVEVEGTKKVRGLNASDAVWRETRGLSYVAARRWMHETLRSIQSFRDGGMAAADVHTLKGFVAELRDKFSRLPLHVSLIEAAGAAFADPVFATRQAAEASLLAEEDDVGAVEDLLYREAPLPVVLRLLALRSITLGGLPRKRLDTLRRDILNTHGFHHLVTLENLAKAGLLGVRNTRRPSGYSALKDPFRLLLPADEVGGRAAAIDATEPEDVHFTYAGYAPLSVRLIELAVTGGWSAAPSGVSSLPGPAFELQQTVDDKGMPAEVEGASASEDTRGTSRRPITLVMFLGGVTAAEVAALRFLASRRLVPCEFVIATTRMVTGSTLMTELCAPEPGSSTSTTEC